MKNTSLICWLGLALGTLASCQNSKVESTGAAFGTCAPESATVRTVTDAKGTLFFDQQSKQYRISASQPGTIDVVDMGVVCGDLPPALQANGKQVLFSGTYKTYSNPPSAPGGTTFYYLELTKLQLQ